jgi:uncharacterized protein YecE (DUF72 family)
MVSRRSDKLPSDSQLALFAQTETASANVLGPAAVSPEVAKLAALLPENLYLGTSSWYFPGWAGIVFDRLAKESVVVREGLRAYAQHPLLRAVGIDRTFYAALSAEQYATYAAQVPQAFRFLVKAPAICTSTVLRGKGSPAKNAKFLDAKTATESFVRPCTEGLGAKAGVLLFQFSPFGKTVTREPGRFAEHLHAFLDELPRGPCYAVELRNSELFTQELLQALASARTQYCYNLHPRMPPLTEQIELMRDAVGGPLIVRWNLHAGLGYEEARDGYTPFNRLVDADLPNRQTLAKLCAAALKTSQTALVIANNKAEGSAPLTLLELAKEIAKAL